MALWHNDLTDSETELLQDSEDKLKADTAIHKALKVKLKSRAESRIRQRKNKADQRRKIIEYSRLLEQSNP